MPALETKDLYQTVVLWPAAGTNTHGETIVGTPIEIRVRWTLRRTESTDPKGNVISLDGTMVVAQPVATESAVFLGTLDEWYGHGTGTGSGAFAPEVYRVATYQRGRDLKNRFARRTLGLKKFANRPLTA
jgi:hypothetical protein